MMRAACVIPTPSVVETWGDYCLSCIVGRGGLGSTGGAGERRERRDSATVVVLFPGGPARSRPSTSSDTAAGLSAVGVSYISATYHGAIGPPSATDPSIPLAELLGQVAPSLAPLPAMVSLSSPLLLPLMLVSPSTSPRSSAAPQLSP